MVDSLSFRVGSSNREHVIVRPSRREYPEAEDYDDGNWVYATIEIAAGAFQGTFEAMLRAEEFVRFRDELRPLYDRLSGKATFDTRVAPHRRSGGRQRPLPRSLRGDRSAGLGQSRLTFKIDFDQTELPAIVQGLDAICEAVPVVGARGSR